MKLGQTNVLTANKTRDFYYRECFVNAGQWTRTYTLKKLDHGNKEKRKNRRVTWLVADVRHVPLVSTTDFGYDLHVSVKSSPGKIISSGWRK